MGLELSDLIFDKVLQCKKSKGMVEPKFLHKLFLHIFQHST